MTRETVIQNILTNYGQYISKEDVESISFADMTIRAVETTTAALVPQNEVFGLDDLREFKIRLVNNGGMADIVDFCKFIKSV